MSETISLTVTGMKCGGCESSVKSKLNSLEGVISVIAISKEKKVEVEFDPKAIKLEAISFAINEAGYCVE